MSRAKLLRWLALPVLLVGAVGAGPCNISSVIEVAPTKLTWTKAEAEAKVIKEVIFKNIATEPKTFLVEVKAHTDKAIFEIQGGGTGTNCTVGKEAKKGESCFAKVEVVNTIPYEKLKGLLIVEGEVERTKGKVTSNLETL
jgi:hypothetical protein